MNLYQQIIAALRAQDTDLSDEKLHEFSLEIAQSIENQSDLASLPEKLFTQEIIRLSPTIQIMVAENESSIQDAAQYAFRIVVNQVTDDPRSTIPQQYCSEEYCPYPGLTAFSEANANYFCGRDGEIEAFLKQIDQRPLIALTGPSGVGKSSFILAGVLPHLEAQFGETAVYLTLPIHTNTDLLQDLASLLSAEVDETAEIIVEALKQRDSALLETVQTFLGHGKQHVFLILDQFEVVFVGEDANRKYERNRFLDNLLYAEANGPDSFLTTIITTRENFFEHPAYTNRTRLVEIIQHENVPLRPLNNSQLRQTIEQPLAIFNQQYQSNLKYQDGLVQLIVNAFRNPAVSLPLVQYLLRLLWIEKRHLTHFAYNSLGGLERVLDRHALEIYKGFADDEQNLVKAILIALVRPGISGEYTRKRIQREMLLANRELMQQQKIMAILNRLSDGRSRIISEQQVDNTIYLELTHEIILRQWAFLQELIEARKEHIEERERLLPTAELWLASRATRGEIGDPSYLYQGRSSLQRVKRFIDSAQYPEDIDTTIAACYRASQKYRKRTLFRNLFVTIGILIIFSFIVNSLQGQLASEGQRADENATAQAMAQAGQTEARATAVAEATQRAYAQAEVTVQAEIGATAVSAQIAEEQQKRIVLAHELAAESQGINTEYPQLGVLLAIESIFATYSHNELPTIEAKQALYDALAEIGGTPLLEEIAPNEHVFDIDLSPNGQWLALISAIENENTSYQYDYHQSTIRLWDIKNKGFISEPIVLNGMNIGEDNLAFSADNQWLITSDHACINGGTTTLWDLSQPILTNYVLEGCQIAYSPDGRWLITAPDAESYRSEIYLWDLFNVDTSANPIVFGNRHKAVFSHNGQWVATASETDVSIWNLSVIGLFPDPIVLPHQDDNVVSLTFSPDDNWIVVGTSVVGEQGGNMALWNVSELLESVPVQTLFKSDIDVFSEIKFSPDSSKLFANSTNIFSENSRFFLWDLEDINRDPISIIRNVDEQASTVFSSDSHWLATVGNNSIMVWDISSSENINTTPVILSGINTNLTADTGLLTSSSASHIVFSSDNRWLAASSISEETVHLWSLSISSSYDQPITLSGHEGAVSIFFSSDNRWLITSSTSDKTVRLWDLQHLQNLRGEIVGNGYLTLSNHDNSVRELAISPDGRWLAATGGTGGTSGNVNKIWDLQATDSPPIDLNIQDKSVVSLAFNPDGTWFATGTREGDIDFWDTSLQNWDSPIFTLSNDNEVLDIEFSPDKQWLATGGNDGRVDFWNLETLSKENILTINGEKVTSLAFSPDGKWLAIGSDDDMGATSSKATIRILDLETQQTIHTLTDLGTYIGDMAFSPDGQWFAAYTGFYHDWYGSVSLWKSSAIEEPPQVFTGKSLAFSPDGQWLALEGGGTIYEHEPTKLWRLSSADNLVSDFISLTGNSSFGDVLFSPDGNWLITGHFEEVRLWPLQIDILVDLACHTVGRNLTLSEWETYFPQEDYRKTCFN